LKIAYASTFDPTGLGSWSGCSHHLARALLEDESVSLAYVGPLAEKQSPIFPLKRTLYRLAGRNYLPKVDPRVLRDYARQTAAALDKIDADVILSLDAHPIAYLETRKPIVYYWDCTFQGNLEYPWFRALASESVAYGHQMEQRALEKCRLAVFSSDWAVQTAIDGYGVDTSKLRVAPLGANLDCDRTADTVARIVDGRSRTRCDLLFLGIDWKRKGGDVAYDVAKSLNAMGLETTLTIVGCAPEVDEAIPPYVTCLGYIDKADARGRGKIEALLARSHFLILPSVAESFGTVFCEASSFGTPSLARRVGGIPTAVRDGVNGQLFEKDADPAAYARFVLDLFGDFSRYRSLALSSFEEYQSRLNWRHTSRTILDLCRQL
jgi:glycosyltransferase involved in cell wall biosynthesis